MLNINCKAGTINFQSGNYNISSPYDNNLIILNFFLTHIETLSWQHLYNHIIRSPKIDGNEFDSKDLRNELAETYLRIIDNLYFYFFKI